jgi:HK97 family phage portal protein
MFSHGSDAVVGKDATSFSALDLIASSFAGLSGQFYDRDTRQNVKDHYLYDLINFPNADETKFQFFYNSAVDYFSSGNVYYYLFDLDGEIVSMFRLNPANVRVKRDSNNRKVFVLNGQDYTSEKILHIPSRYGYNGLVGKSIFSVCGQIFSNTSELDSYINNSFNNGVGNRLIIDISKEFPQATDEQIQQLRNKFLQNYSGIQNSGKPLIKSGKIEYNKMETEYKDNRASQLVENRAFQEKEVAKLFGVPLALLNGTETNNIESLYTVFIENAIKPIATQFEQSINRMIPLKERHRLYFEYSYNSLMKTSLQTRIDAYVKQITHGILSPNEARRKENLQEKDAGDTLFVPANSMPLRQDVIDSYMAKSKKIEENLASPNTKGDHSNLGDDKA